MDNLPDLLTLAHQVNAEHDACLDKLGAGLAHAMNAGRLLLQAKEQVGHGAWSAWVRDNCQFSLRTAQGYMRVARHAAELGTEGSPAAALDGEGPVSFRRALAMLASPAEPVDDGDCSPLSPEEVERLNALEVKIQAGLEESGRATLEAGRLAMEERDRLGPEAFEPWLSATFPRAKGRWLRLAVEALEAGLEPRKAFNFTINALSDDELTELFSRGLAPLPS